MIKIIEVRNVDDFKGEFNTCILQIKDAIVNFAGGADNNAYIDMVTEMYLLTGTSNVLFKELLEHSIEIDDNDIIQVSSYSTSHKIVIPDSHWHVCTIKVDVDGDSKTMTISSDIINLSFQILIHEENYHTIQLTKSQCIDLLKILNTYDEVYNERSNMPTSNFMRDKLPQSIKDMGTIKLEEDNENNRPTGTLPDSSVWNLRKRD